MNTLSMARLYVQSFVAARFPGLRAYARKGQGLVEYALIIALVAIVVIVALHFLGGTIGNTAGNIGNAISNASNNS